MRDDDLIEIVIDRNTLTGTVNLVGADGVPLDVGRVPTRCSAAGRRIRAWRRTSGCPTTRRLWAALQRASGGTWAGCVYDVDRIVAALDAAADGREARRIGSREAVTAESSGQNFRKLVRHAEQR